jgi:hypothetical protein
MSPSAARNLLSDWLNNGVLAIEMCNWKTKLVGLKVARKLTEVNGSTPANPLQSLERKC